MTTDKISLVTIYTECNIHLREMDKNRDQLISFYLVLTGAFLTVFGYLEKNGLGDVLLASSFLLFVLGVFVSRLANEFRIWHTRYSYTATLLSALGRAKTKKEFVKVHNGLLEHSYSEDQLNITSKHMPFQWYLGRNARYMKGTEFYTYLVSVTVSFLPFYSMVHILTVAVYPVTLPTVHFTIFILSFVIYLLIVTYFSARYIYEKFSTSPWATWLLYGIDKKLDLTLKQMEKT
jgi:hypothetical protein